MGSPEKEPGRHNNEDRVEVAISPLSIMDAPVTQRQWYAVTGENPSFFKQRRYCMDGHVVMGGVELCPEHPVEMVSWEDIQKFIERLKSELGIRYRLPTEAEWEYAARAGTVTAYSFGDNPAGLKEYAVYMDPQNQTRKVRSKSANSWGLYDVHGNVWEWTEDVYVEKLAGGIGPLENTVECRTIRGGGWFGYSDYLRSSARCNEPQNYSSKLLGFRLARSLVP